MDEGGLPMVIILFALERGFAVAIYMGCLRIHRINQLAEQNTKIGVSSCTRIRMDGSREYYIVNEYMIDYFDGYAVFNEFMIDGYDGYAAPHMDK